MAGGGTASGGVVSLVGMGAVSCCKSASGFTHAVINTNNNAIKSKIFLLLIIKIF
jgi:hypothetical protein